MKKETIKLTESRLRNLVEACVKEALEDAIEEGYGWDVLSHEVKDHTNDYDDFFTKKDWKDLVNGRPNDIEYRKSKDLYNAAKNGMIYGGNDENGKPYNTDSYSHALDTTIYEPGFKGKVRRAAIATGIEGTKAAKRIGSAAKKGFNKIKNSMKPNKNNSGVEPFEL